MNHAAAHSAATSAGNQPAARNGLDGPATLAAAALLHHQLIGPYVTHTTGCWPCRLVAAVVPTFTK